MKSEEGIQILDFTNELGMIPLREVANINEVTINPKSLDWLNYTDISSVGARTVETPLMVSGQDAPSRARRVLRNGDTVISTVRPNRKSYFLFRDNWDRAIASTGFAVISPKNFQDSEYLHAVLTTDAATAHYESLCEGGAYPAFNPHAIENMQIPWPSRQERELVGSLSSAILRKIETNVRLSNSLESIAQVIFKSWFIDFDPVKAKIAGEKPVGMDDATAALFPDSMEDSELGSIPSGWVLSQIGEEVECVGGSTPSTSNSEFWDGDIFWTTPKDLSRQAGLITTSSERRITSKGLQRISSGILPTYSVLMSSRAPIGYLSISAVPIAINQGFIALRRTPRFASLWLLFWLQRNMPVIKNRAGGGTFAEISKTAFKSIPLLVPGEALLHKFEEISQPILLQLTALTLQNRELASIRDSLLPRLISGELQIPEEMLVS